jgi:hypothetical protein
LGRDSQNSKPRELKVGIAGPVALERRTSAVVLEAIDLHHEASGRPQSVDLVAGDDHVHRGRGQRVVVAEAQKPAFQLGPGLGDRSRRSGK